MSDRDTLPPGPGKGSLSIEETANLWRAFQDGGKTACPRDSGPLAMSIDGGNAYRFVCTRCGTATVWFEVTANGIQYRTIPPPVLGNEDEEDE